MRQLLGLQRFIFDALRLKQGQLRLLLNSFVRVDGYFRLHRIRIAFRVGFRVANFRIGIECGVRRARVAQHFARFRIAHKIFRAISRIGLTHARRTRQHLDACAQHGIAGQIRFDRALI